VVVTTPHALRRSVFSRIEVEVSSRARVFAQVALARQPGAQVTESLAVTSGGAPASFEEVDSAHRGRLHSLVAEPGPLVIEYSATVEGQADPIAAEPSDAAVYLRPSRYAESDRLLAKAYEEFAAVDDPLEIVRAVDNWVSGHLSYVPGSSGPMDGAAETLLARKGVCRDYGHLTVALLRALDVPARLVGVYAPGITPMDFHAVVECLVDGQWLLIDPTELGPRQTMLRMCTGRDAADTAFLSTYDGYVELKSVKVRAVVEGDLPADDHIEAVQLR
jgi:transglutaminase-like putative cysteine protease